MTKNGLPKPIPAPRARAQFTLRELLFFIPLTFLGMLVFVPLFGDKERELGCALVSASTAIGILIGISCSRPDSPRRKRWLIAGILFSWLGSAWFGFLISFFPYNIDNAFAFALTTAPLFIAMFITLLRCERAERRLWESPPSIPWILTTFGACLFLGTLLIPTLLRTRHAPNETCPAAACKAFAEAEEIYHRKDYANAGTLQYATSLQILLGAHGELALVDKTFAGAELGPRMIPKCGYYFKVLTAQGPCATGGRRSYIDEYGHMTKGYAIIAIPAKYDVTGRDCYMINNNGTIFQNDLGEDTAYLASAMTEFDPDTTWVPTQ